MKTTALTLTLMLALTAGVASAQTQTPANKAAAGAAKPNKTAAAKPQPAKKAAAKTTTAKKAPAKAKQLDVAALAAHSPSAEAVLGAAELSIAERVHVGRLPCELGNSVQLTADAERPGYFNLQMAKTLYRLVPVPTTTGAIRLEDAKAGAVWLQLANKSMLMNHKLGQRMADECMSPQQLAVAEQFKTAPPPSVLEGTPAGATVAQPASGR